MPKALKHKTLYLIRHGQTEGNVNGEWLGKKSIHKLNEYGKKQSRYTAKFLKEKGVDASKIFSSSTPRALEHAEILQKRLGLPIDKIHSLSEIDLGILEDRTQKEGLKLVPHEVLDWENNLQKFNPPLGESALEAGERFYEIVELITKNYFKPDIIIVTHGVVLKLFLARLAKESIETGETKIQVPWTNHGSITIVKYDSQSFKLVEVFENKFPDSDEVASFG
ncbi:histidine phosphatase family protein [Patescibacteria group bacterium]